MASMRGYCLCDLSLTLALILSLYSTFILFEVKLAMMVGQKTCGFTTWFRVTLSPNHFPCCRTPIIGTFINSLWGADEGCHTRLWRLSVALLWSHYSYCSTVTDALGNQTGHILSSCVIETA